MSNVLQQIANVHRNRFAETEKLRREKENKLKQQQAYFRDTGIPEMWDDVKNIKIPNPTPEALEGFTVPLEALLDTTIAENIQQTGLMLNDRKDYRACWLVESNGVDANKTNKIVYRAYIRGKTHTFQQNDPEAKKKFCDTFIRWLAKYITPHMLLEMNIDLDVPAPSVIKRSRKILQLAET